MSLLSMKTMATIIYLNTRKYGDQDDNDDNGPPMMHYLASFETKVSVFFQTSGFNLLI